MAVEVKICGLTRAVDAALAVRSGAARLGVIFAGGPRRVTVPEAREVVHAAAGVPVIGVFAPQDVDEILRIASQTGLRGVQFHRAATTAERTAIRRAGYELWQVARVGSRNGPQDPVLDQASELDVLLFEPPHPEGGGGHGIPLSLAAAAETRARIRECRVALAGGLRADTVAEAIRVVEPDLVDVSSGVEISPGTKDPELLSRFLERVRDAGTTA